MPKSLVLASTSPYRRQLLTRLRLPFETVAPEVDETPRAGEAAPDRALRLAAEKAVAGSALRPGALVIGGDQVAALGDSLLRTPGDVATARQQLAASSGQTVDFFSALALAEDGRLLASRCVPVTVHFRSLGSEEIDSYLAQEPALDCAGSFRWESLGITLFRSIASDDPTALTGLPLIALGDMLREQGINPLVTGA